MSTASSPATLLFTATSVVESPVEKVTQAALDELGKPRDSHLIIDAEHHQVVLEGDWWYRGVYSFEAHERGTVVTYRAFNIARKFRFMVPLVLLQLRLAGQLKDIQGGNLEDFTRQLISRLGLP